MATAPANPFIFTLCYATDASGAMLLLAQRQLIQKWVGGNPDRGIIPSWAGQWGVITEQPLKMQPVEQTAYAAFLAQTGVNLGDATVAKRYGVLSAVAKNLQDKALNSVPVFYVSFTPDGLKSLSTDIQANLAAHKILDGVLQTVEIKSPADAKILIAPVMPPPDGWKAYLVKNYYGGTSPGQLNTEIDQLTAQLTLHSAEPPTGALIAIDNLPQSGSPTPQPKPEIVETYTMIANNNPYPIKISATIKNESDWASTTNRPDKTFAGATFEPFGMTTGRADLASTASSAQVQLIVTIEGEPTAFTFSYDQKLALSIIGDQPVEVMGTSPKYVLYLSTQPTNEGKPQLVILFTEQRGG